MGEEDDSTQNEKNYAESAAQHLANLTGTSVAGKIPDSSLIDLDSELFRSNNVSLASLVILSALIKGEKYQREKVLSDVKVGFFKIKSFERYLFEISSEMSANHEMLPIPFIEEQIIKFTPRVYDEQPSDSFLEELQFKWSQIMQFNPTPAQLERAIELRRLWINRRG